MDEGKITAFQQTVSGYYRQNGRHDLPWRKVRADGTIDPYMVLVSEIMLQQTQVQRVLPKFMAFMARFPDIRALAAAPLADVLVAWSGLGYNRRAKFLWQAGRMVVDEYASTLPRTTAELVRLPGVGVNTAGAVLAYAYGMPVVFIETNIRTVYIHHFFTHQEVVADKEIAGVVAATLPDDTRTWYWGLMDYGTYLKRTVKGVNARSKQYKKQSVFQGSRRQVRGVVLRLLTARPYTLEHLQAEIKDERLDAVIAELRRESLITKKGAQYQLYEL